MTKALERLVERERERFVAAHPRSAALFEEGRRTLIGGVPMSWMTMWPAASRSTSGRARSAAHGRGRPRVRGPLPGGHRRDGRPLAGRHRGGRGAQDPAGTTTMLLNEDAAAVGAELRRRFG